MGILMYGSIAIVILLVVWIYVQFGSTLKRRAERKRELWERDKDAYDEYNNPWIPDFLEKNPQRGCVLLAILFIGLIMLFGCFKTIPAGHRGVLLTMGKVEDRILGEGFNFKLPVIQRVEQMNVQIQKVESTESTASHDLQEVSTTVAVNYKLNPSHVNVIYQTLHHEYADRVIKPNIEESLKTATAQFTAEELITRRADMKRSFDIILMDRLAVFHIEVVAVSLTDFQFSQSFSDAIEAKVTAEQKAMEAKNKLVQIEYEAQQQVIQAEAARNATITRALGEAQAKVIGAQAGAQAKILDANATAASILMITEQMTTEYAQWLHLTRWDGKYPTTMLGTVEDLGIIVNTGGE